MGWRVRTGDEKHFIIFPNHNKVATRFSLLCYAWIDIRGKIRRALTRALGVFLSRCICKFYPLAFPLEISLFLHAIISTQI